MLNISPMIIAVLLLYITVNVNANYLKFEEETSTASTTCVCTTVPCPVAGNNYLTEGDLVRTSLKWRSAMFILPDLIIKFIT